MEPSILPSLKRGIPLLLALLLPLLLPLLLTDCCLRCVQSLFGSSVLHSFLVSVPTHSRERFTQETWSKGPRKVKSLCQVCRVLCLFFYGQSFLDWRLFFAGARVRRGQNWRWDDQDGGVGSEGTIICLDKDAGWVRVRWNANGNTNRYECDFSLHSCLHVPHFWSDIALEAATRTTWCSRVHGLQLHLLNFGRFKDCSILGSL